MTLPVAPNALSLQDVNVELILTPTNAISMNDTAIRIMTGNTTPNTQNSMSGLRGKGAYYVEYMVVGGGGGGGSGFGGTDGTVPGGAYSYIIGGGDGVTAFSSAGGGGGGGQVLNATTIIKSGTTYTITIGDGGAAETKGGTTTVTSSVLNLSADGGGYGGKGAPPSAYPSSTYTGTAGGPSAGGGGGAGSKSSQGGIGGGGNNNGAPGVPWNQFSDFLNPPYRVNQDNTKGGGGGGGDPITGGSAYYDPTWPSDGRIGNGGSGQDWYYIDSGAISTNRTSYSEGGYCNMYTAGAGRSGSGNGGAAFSGTAYPYGQPNVTGNSGGSGMVGFMIPNSKYSGNITGTYSIGTNATYTLVIFGYPGGTYTA
jgi:hypothetical protein